MSDWKEVSNWEACKAKGEGKEVEYFDIDLDKWEKIIEKDWHLPPNLKYRIKKSDPARLFGKVIWTKDGKEAQVVDVYVDGKYKMCIPWQGAAVRELTAEQIEKEFDVKVVKL